MELRHSIQTMHEYGKTDFGKASLFHPSLSIRHAVLHPRPKKDRIPELLDSFRALDETVRLTMTETLADENRDPIENSDSPGRVNSFVQWLFLSAVIAVGLGVLGGMLPARVKLLGIFAVLQSLLLTLIIANLFRSFLLEPRKLFFFVVSVLIAIQSATSFWISFRDYSSSMERQQKENPSDVLLDKFLQSDRDDSGHSIVEEEFRKAREISNAKLRFSAYLHHRVAELGNWSSPWPELFAGMEILLAIVMGLYFFRLGIRKSVSVSGL